LFDALAEELIRLEAAETNMLSYAEAAIEICRDYLSQLKMLVETYGFADNDEEIVFFKHRKPEYLSRLIYYKGLYDLYSRWPEGSEIVKREYLKHGLDRLHQFFKEHDAFYVYYRTRSAHLDYKYFVRGQLDIHLLPDAFYFEKDTSFSTGYDFLLSQIIANQRLLTYIERLLKQPDSFTPVSSSTDSSNTPSLTWTGSKTDLVELLYGLHSVGAFNNGNADLKLIATCLQQAFHIDLGNYYNIFQDIPRRKTGQTKFLDNMKTMLMKKIDEME
jgi:hypothetical protein